MKYEKLFKKGHIGNLEIKNRIVMPAMGTNLASYNGEASNELIRYYEERAKGGCGLIITEITRVDDETGVGMPNQLSVMNLKQIPRLQTLARTVHKYNTKIFVQLQHPGRQNHAMMIDGRQIAGPSPIMSSAIGEMPREMTIEEIGGLVVKFVKGAVFAQMAGIDGVEIHGAHGYLVAQFMSPQSNHREDKYGGTFEKRMRFITEIIMGIRAKCGELFPISVRIDGNEFTKDGITLDEAIQEAVYLENLGVNAINVSAGTYESVTTIIEPISYPQGWKRNLAKAIKAAVSIPVIACDVIRKPDMAETILKEDNLDFVAVGRAQLADPEWGNKSKEGREEDITPCISCLNCIESIMKCGNIECAVNPRVGRELEYLDFPKTGDDRKVVIVGGGPAGMEAARVLALRKFVPIIFEEKDCLGGNVYLATKPPLKEKLDWFLEYQKLAIKKLNVMVRLNEKATLEKINEINPYAVFISSGSNPIVPPIPGIDKSFVYTSTDVLENKVVLENKNIVIAGSGMTGLEIAELLTSKGNKVTVIEMADKIGPSGYLPNVIDISMRLAKAGVVMLPCSKLTNIKDGEIDIENTKDKKVTTIKTDVVVLSLGVKSNKEIVTQVEEHYDIVELLGDVLKPGRVVDAVLNGFEKAYML
ncbi:NAD(P)/FAD-dependent oxidoreductase [Clostridium sp.]|uniref:NAD(P)/FAD-dependent oxidoreductase n=1 Tax=Clostridium sp. TaxID=1506 RepID=UPI002632FAA1|nr:NAD(P)/FAD-dependent oxidoreductase [uncultured Clostridium sp.]